MPVRVDTSTARPHLARCREIASHLVIRTGKKRGQHPAPATVMRMLRDRDEQAAVLASARRAGGNQSWVLDQCHAGQERQTDKHAIRADRWRAAASE
ncbi:hypothetical protein OG625_39055 [Streptomyces sp. NBC_01351]|uniref:hypothetical protein n=1 Tax=Streptomyces sp. NBC_01351 TaxID=2903833 RepID=UPI002E3450D0|nr:hypothetical protein [Streptomyces sp. NBC_01351]